MAVSAHSGRFSFYALKSMAEIKVGLAKDRFRPLKAVSIGRACSYGL